MIVGNGGVEFEVSGGTAAVTEMLIVLKIEYSNNGNEVVTLWVDPANESSDPAIDNMPIDFLNWDGGSSNWSNGLNWDLGVVPSAPTNVTINSTASLTVTGPTSLTEVTSLLVDSQTSLRLGRQLKGTAVSAKSRSTLMPLIEQMENLLEGRMKNEE